MNTIYSLQKYTGLSSRVTCPACKEKHSFALYVDANNTPIHSTCGRCNRESKCGWHLSPKQYFEANGGHPVPIVAPRAKIKTKKAASFIDPDLFRQSLADYGRNNFIQFLISRFDEATVSGLIRNYRIGTSQHWPGSTIFYQVDQQNKVRAGKIVQYNPTTGKRTKEPYSHITWLHSALKMPDFNLSQCLFGLHLIDRDKSAPVCVVEAEKTAVICSAFYPDKIWVSVGGKQNLNSDMLAPLAGRDVVLFPDVDGFDLWTEKSKTLNLRCSVSDYLTKNATAPEQSGFDLADWLLLKADFKPQFKEKHSGRLVEPPEPKKPEIKPQMQPGVDLPPLLTVGDVLGYAHFIGMKNISVNI